MSATLGLELGPELIRGVRIDRWGAARYRTFEQHWDPAEPAAAFKALAEGLCTPGRIAVTVDLAFLFAKQVRLPAIPLAEKRRILTLEPERFFPIRGEELVLALRAEDNLVFAARAAELGAWLTVLETIAPVELVEASPVSLARALHRAGGSEATLIMEEKNEGVAIVAVGSGRINGIRRIRGEPDEMATAVSAAAGTTGPLFLRPLNGNRDWRPGSRLSEDRAGEMPSVHGLASPYLAAFGAAVGIGGNPDESLLPSAQRGRLLRRRTRRLVMSVLVCALSLILALTALDGFRSRSLNRLDGEISRLRTRAEGAMALDRQVGELSREASAVATMEAARVDMAGALSALTRRLPTGAYLQTLRGSGADWQIDGYAREAAPLVARLEEDPNFEDVHFLTATSRTRLNGKVYESFSIAFRLVPAP